LEELVVVGRILLKCILKNLLVGCGLDWAGSK